jgi:hypothetical protein
MGADKNSKPVPPDFSKAQTQGKWFHRLCKLVPPDFSGVTWKPRKSPNPKQTDSKRDANLTLVLSCPKKLFHQKSPQKSTIDQTGATGFLKPVPQSFA